MLKSTTTSTVIKLSRSKHLGLIWNPKNILKIFAKGTLQKTKSAKWKKICVLCEKKEEYHVVYWGIPPGKAKSCDYPVILPYMYWKLVLEGKFVSKYVDNVCLLIWNKNTLLHMHCDTTLHDLYFSTNENYCCCGTHNILIESGTLVCGNCGQVEGYMTWLDCLHSAFSLKIRLVLISMVGH